MYSEDKIEAIFDTFTRVRTKDRIFEGTGLGLSIAKSLVEQQGGKISATSVEGEGSTFFFDLILEVGDQNFKEDLGDQNEEYQKEDATTCRKFASSGHDGTCSHLQRREV